MRPSPAVALHDIWMAATRVEAEKAFGLFVATVRLRTVKTKGSGSRIACLTMVFKLVMSAQKNWRALDGASLLAQLNTPSYA
jgi:hypothetical protein